MIATETFKPGVWDIDPAGYHADTTATNHHALEDFRESVPLYYQRYVSQTLARTEPTDAMKLGTALHALVLQPERVDELVGVAPEGDRRTKAGKEAWAAFQATAGGKTVVTQEQWCAARMMADSVLAHGLARDLLTSPGRSELAVRWLHPSLEVPLKVLFDRQLDCGVSLDIKTAAEPHPAAWVRQAVNFGIHRQAALYLDGRQHGLGVHGEEFLHIVVGSKPPYECLVVALDESALLLGRQQNEETLHKLHGRLMCDDWQSEWADEIVRLSLPRWAYQ